MPAQLHDVLDVEAFVKATLRNMSLRLTRDEREELVGEGLLIMVELARGYRPDIGTFGGYAAGMLPRRLTDSWHVGLYGPQRDESAAVVLRHRRPGGRDPPQPVPRRVAAAPPNR